MTQSSESFDAIVVGSGISGGWAAKELTERGLRVLMLERGKDVEHRKDYKNARKAPWEYPHRGARTREMVEAYQVLQRDYPLNEKNLDWWVNERDAPYTEVKRFDWYRGYHVGGRSLTWGRQSYRLSDFDFEANLKDGIAIDWPIRYADVSSWYDHVERHAGISGSIEHLPQLPDGQFQPAMSLNCAEEMIAGRLAKLFEGRRRIIPGRVANLTRAVPGRTPCQYRNACALGCPTGSYFSTQASTLPAAKATGRLTMKTFAIVTDVVYDRDRKRATGVRVMDAVTKATTEYSAPVVFLCASALNSTWLLMRSATDVWPGGLGSSSGELGHNLMDHHFRCGADGTIVEQQDRTVYGRRPTGYYIPRYRNFFGDKREYLRGFGVQFWNTGASDTGAHNGSETIPGFGAALKTEIKRRHPAWVEIHPFGETLPYANNRITVGGAGEDRYGVPLMTISYEVGENERKMTEHMADTIEELAKASGVELVNYKRGALDRNGSAIHEHGTCRMGEDPKRSALNKFNQMHDVSNVFVVDGSSFASATEKNPTLTILALSMRATDDLADQMKQGVL